MHNCNPICVIDTDDFNYGGKIKTVLLFRKVVKVERSGDQDAYLYLDNGIVLLATGNKGCGGCENGWYYLKDLNDCENAITNVEVSETELAEDKFDDAFTIFVYAEDKKIKLLQYEGCDNGYYGTGYTVTVYPCNP